MANLTKDERLQNVWDKASQLFDKAYGRQQQIRLASLEDRRFAFVDGAQWEGGLGDQFMNRPRFAINKVQKVVKRIVSEYRANAMTVNFRSADDSASSDDLDALRIVYRSDEQYSSAQDTYVAAFEEAVSGGMGAWRLTNDYDGSAEVEIDDDTPQRILFEPIPDADSSVFFDPNSRKPNKSDAKWCVVLNPISWDTYTSEYIGDAVDTKERPGNYKDSNGDNVKPSSFKMTRRLGQFDWFTNDSVYIGEYYEVENKTEEYTVFREPHSGQEQKVYSGLSREEKEDAADESEYWKSIGYIRVRSGKRRRQRVRKYFLDGVGVLKDCGYIAGSYIPIIVVFGMRQIIDGIERFQGAVRLAKDSQRLYNMQLSTLADITSFTPRQKPIFTPEQIAGHELTWAQDNVSNFPYLLVNPITDQNGNKTVSGPVSSVMPPDVPPALAGLVQLSASDITDVTGGDLAAEEVRSNTSDALVSRVQAHQDMQVYVFIDNMSRALQWCGKVYLSMAADTYTEDNRKFSAVAEDNSQESTTINVPSINQEGEQVVIRQFTPGLDVFVDVGPAFNSRKDATVNAIAKILPGVADQQTQQLMLMTICRNLDGEGMEDLAKWARKQLISAGVVEPNEEEKKEIAAQQQAAANAPPDAATVALIAQARESDANATKSHASAVQSLSTAELNQAKAAESVSKTNSSNLGTIMGTLNAIEQRTNGTAAQVAASQPQHAADPKVAQAISSNNAQPSPGLNPLHGVTPAPTAADLTANNPGQ